MEPSETSSNLMGFECFFGVFGWFFFVFDSGFAAFRCFGLWLLDF